MDNLSSLSMPMAALVASLIGATATISAALIQLIIAWRREKKAHEGRDPISRKSRRGMVWAVAALMAASALGGFAFSQYLATESRREAHLMEQEFGARMERLAYIAERLERAAERLMVPAVIESVREPRLKREDAPSLPAQEPVIIEATADPLPSAGGEPGSAQE